MAHFTCVGATVDELRETLDQMRDAGIENVLALRGDPPAGQDEWTATEGGLSYSRELIELIRADYDFAIGAACFPEVHIHADRPGVRPALPQGEGRRRRALPDHAAVLRQRRLLRLRRARARRRDRRPDHPGDHADHQRWARSSASRACAARRSRRAADASSSCAPTSPRRWPTSASPTRRCSAPTCSPTARPGSTSTRSTSRLDARDPRARCARWRPGGSAWTA